MHLIFFSPADWEGWGLGRRPLIPRGMPVLVDDDLVFEDNGVLRPAAVANLWLRELPVSGAPAQKTWKSYAQALRSWLKFLASVDVPALGERAELRSALSAFSEFRFAGPLGQRWDGATWTHNVNTVARFYQWAFDEGYCEAVPFTYTMVQRFTEAGVQVVRRNTASAMDRLLRGDLPPDGKCDLKTLAHQAGVPRTGFYPKKNRDGTTRPGPYQHLAEEFQRRLQARQDAGESVDPRVGQIERLQANVTELKERVARRDETMTGSRG